MSELSPIRLAVVAPNGRMGAAVLSLAQADPAFAIAARIVLPSQQGGLPLDEVNPSDVDVMIDFSSPEAVAAHGAWCADHGVAWVLGTTGLSLEDEAAVQAAAEKVPVFVASNFSLGVALLLDLAARAARVLGTEADVEIIEAHHNHKRDAPSGTALSLAGAVATARGQTLSEVLVCGREGLVGERPQGEIGMHSLRLADVVGRHELHFGWPLEGLSLTHEARDRRVFAAGSLKAARFVAPLLRRAQAGVVGMSELIENP